MNQENYQQKEHQAFANWITRNMIFSILGALVSMIGSGIAAKNHFESIAFIFIVLFLGCAFYALFYLNYRLRHVSCPQCGTQCVSGKDAEIRQWIATCEQCKINWLLGVGSKRIGIF